MLRFPPVGGTIAAHCPHDYALSHFQKRVNDAIKALIKKQVTPWVFMTTGRPFHIKRLDGTDIAYHGIGFEGSPKKVFWSGYIEPFLEHLCITCTAPGFFDSVPLK